MEHIKDPNINPSSCHCDNCLEYRQGDENIKNEILNKCRCPGNNGRYNQSSSNCKNCGKWIEREAYCGTRRHHIKETNSDHNYNSAECKEKLENHQNLDECDKCHQDIGANYVEYDFANLNEYSVTNNRTEQNYRICPKCYVCSYCKSKPFEIITNEDSTKWKPDIWLCKDCSNNATPREEDGKNKERERRNPKPINLGPDYDSLKAPQQEGRQKTQASWIKKKNTSFLHFECDKLFAFDQTIESYYEALSWKS